MRAATRAMTPDEVAAAVQQLQQGATFAGGRVTLTAGATSTTVKMRWCSARSNVILSPLTATAATAQGAGAVYATPGAQQFVVTHNNTADTDRHFAFLVLNTDTN